jgi:hypothetical protein
MKGTPLFIGYVGIPDGRSKQSSLWSDPEYQIQAQLSDRIY